MVQEIIHIISGLVFLYLAVNTLYLLLLALAGRVLPVKKFYLSPGKKRIAVLIPTYREDAIIVDTASRAADHNYPADFFTVVVIADKLKESTVQALRAIPVQVIEVDLNMKSRSLNKALHTLSAEGFRYRDDTGCRQYHGSRLS